MKTPPWMKKLLEVFYKLLYNQFSWTYDAVAWLVSVGHWNDWVFTILPKLAGQRILELGPGPGHLQRQAAQRGINIYGLDLSPTMARQSANRMRKAGLTAKITNGDGQHIPYAAGSFDQVIATFPAEYLFQAHTVREIHRVLTPRGKLLILPFASLAGTSFLHRFSVWLFKVTGQTPAHYPNKEKISQHFADLGFSLSFENVYRSESNVWILTAEKKGS